MNVEKKEEIVIPTQTYSDYYKLKSKYEEGKKCPNCKKTDTVVFNVSGRVLSATCSTSLCKSNMRIFEDTYITYDEKAGRCKQDYAQSIDSILRAKFDILFDYNSLNNIEQLRKNYLAQKAEYDALYTQWEKTDPNHPELKKDRAELIQKLKMDYSPAICDQLNDVLNKIHTIEYTRVHNEIIPTPLYELEIRTLDEMAPKPIVKPREIPLVTEVMNEDSPDAPQSPTVDTQKEMNEDSPPQSPTVDTPQKEMNEDSPDVPQTPTENDTRRKENDDRIAQIDNWHKEETKRARAKRMDENSPQWAVELGNWYKEEEEQLKRTRDPTHKEQIKEKLLFIKNTISIRTEYEDADWKREYRRLKKS
jgi:hypothetical protein